MLWIENVTGRHLQVNPSDEQRAEFAAAVVVLEKAIGDGGALRVGRCRAHGVPILGEQESTGDLSLRCLSGVAEVRVIAYQGASEPLTQAYAALTGESHSYREDEYGTLD
jgi:hypothetical protein